MGHTIGNAVKTLLFAILIGHLLGVQLEHAFYAAAAFGQPADGRA
jgi:hypothetical protein